jgi:dTDP-4-dehydrorhamnose reductase
MKILVTGANGQLGSEFKVLSSIHHKHNWVFTDVTELDITDFKHINNNLSKINPDLIINCAAYTNVDGAESEEKLANLLNFKAVDSLSKWTSNIKRRCFNIPYKYIWEI